MFIRYVDANHPGASEDTLVWNSSEFRENLKKNYQKGEKNTWLLGAYYFSPSCMSLTNI